MGVDWQPFLLSFQLAAVTTVILFLIAVPVAAWLSFTSSKLKPALEAVFSLPLVLPPSVLGFYLLIFFSPANAFGHWLQSWFNIRLLFSFSGLVVASVIYSLPFMIQPVQAGLQSLPSHLSQASYTLGKSRWQTLLHVLLPNIKPSLLTGIVLTFAHTIGDFGLVLMIGGNIAGQTRTASIAVYDEVEALNYHTAHVYAAALLIFSFLILLLVYSINKRLHRSVAGL